MERSQADDIARHEVFLDIRTAGLVQDDGDLVIADQP